MTRIPAVTIRTFRFGSATPKAMFFLVKFLEDVGYQGPRHFDAHAYRTEDIEGVKDFARGCMRTYVIFKEKARQWNEDKEIQAIVQEIAANNAKGSQVGSYSPAGAQKLLATPYDRVALAQKGLQYERLDQLTMELADGRSLKMNHQPRSGGFGFSPGREPRGLWRNHPSRGAASFPLEPSGYLRNCVPSRFLCIAPCPIVYY